MTTSSAVRSTVGRALLQGGLAACIGWVALPASAEEEVAAQGIPPASEMCAPADVPAVRRRRPGQAAQPVLEYALPTCDPGRISPWTAPLELGPAVPDRWRIVQALGYQEQIWDPYNAHNPLKGDLPVWGEDWFFSVTAISDTIVEPRRFPIPVGVSTTSRPGSLDLIGRGESSVFATTLLTEFVVYKGDTTFRPPDWEFRFIPVLNYNEVHFDERGIIKIQPNAGDGNQGRTRKEFHLGIQGLFVDKHLWNVSDRFDFDSLRVGIQPISADFRGFLFQDQQLGIRLFGTRDNNLIQYNVAAFQRMEKDINTGLNDHSEALRDDWVFMANLYWQDFPTLGHTSQVTAVHNMNREKGDVQFDDNGFIARPASLFQERFARDYDVTYLGYNGDGHFGRWNLTTSLYWALGEQTNDRFRGAKDEINAQFAAAELSHDWDWVRLRLSGLWASGDDDAFDDEATGFDAIFENPLFAGADTSFWIRQPVPLIGGGGVSLSGRNGVLNSLRSSKEQGQSNFINPGTRLLGIGGDFDVTPETRVSFNANELWFDDTAVVETVRNQGNVDSHIGTDLSLSVIYRPFMTQNVVFRLSGAVLLPGDGFKDLYGRDEATPYSVLANLVLMY
ncbi:MAG TPA: hypothetical protein VLA56_12265 [Pseudomonadales bacterium]|nr:hypothetical protein [Pseudomonadales bacterium]